MNTPTDFTPSFWSVGGDSLDRVLRDGLLRELDPSLLSYAVAGSSYDERESGFFIPPVIDTSMIHTSELMKPTIMDNNDLMIVIGHCDYNDIIKFYPIEKKSKIEILVQGLGFNMNNDTYSRLCKDMGEERIHLIPANECPRWSAKQWEKIIDSYPNLLKQKLRQKQLVNFYLSRKKHMIKNRKQEDGTEIMTSAFYNQFGIIPDKVSTIMAFEGEVIEYVLNSTANETLRNWCNILLSKLPKTMSFNTKDKKAPFIGSPDELFRGNIKDTLGNVCDLFEKYPIEKQFYPNIMKALMSIIVKYSKGIKEYDSYAINKKLHEFVDMKPPSGNEHYILMLHILNENYHNIPKIYIQFKHKIRQKFNSEKGNKVVVLHDLGLDPQNDDWLAIKLVRYLFA